MAVHDFTTLDEGAISTHELFTAYIKAGFTRDEALKLVIGIITEALPKKDQDNGGNNQP